MSLFDLKAQFQAGALSKPAYIAAMHRLHERLFEYAEFIRATDIARIEITDGAVTLVTRRAGIKMQCDPRDWRAMPLEVLNFGAYELAEWAMMRQLIPPGATMLDVGANLGWYTLHAAQADPNLQVHAFEPIPTTFGYLERNVALNGLHNVRLYNFGFSNQPGPAVFYFYPEGAGNAAAADLSGAASTQKVICELRTLDGFIQETGLTVDFLKCDVEGAELFVFQGGLEMLRSQKPIIFSEMLRKWSAAFGYHPNDIIALLGGIGYRCFSIREGHLLPFTVMDENTVETNFFFLHPTRHQNYIEALVVGLHPELVEGEDA